MNRVKVLRIAKGYKTSRELVDAFNRTMDDKNKMTSCSSIVRLEREETNPRWGLVYNLSRFFGVSAEYLMGVSNNP